MKHPKNETDTHFLLKEIAKYILHTWGYVMIGTEVGGMYSYDLRSDTSTKNVIDTVGVKKVSKFIPIDKRIDRNVSYNTYYDVRGIEAKASLSDYKNGFCAAPAHTYIIAPLNIIPVDLIPDKIGLIEVNFDDFKLKKVTNKIEEIKGVNIAKRAKRRIDSRFKDTKGYKKWCQETIDRVAYRCTQELLFWRNYIEFTT